jgi:RNA polymerase sigma-70 factor (ECF subfamily)
MSQRQCAPLLTQLVDQHYASLYRYAYRLSGSSAEAEDLTQQTFLAAAAKWDQLREADRAKSWLFTILRNQYLKNVRRESAFGWESLDNLVESGGVAVLDADVDSEQLQRVLNELPEEFRSPLILFYFEEFSYAEIAEHLGVALGTVMSRLSRGKAYLRRRLVGCATADTP